MISFEGMEPELDYPCRWTYKVIGSDEARVRTAIGEIVRDLEHTVEPSRKSRTGKYVSLELQVVVRDTTERRSIGEALHRHRDVRWVI